MDTLYIPDYEYEYDFSDIPASCTFQMMPDTMFSSYANYCFANHFSNHSRFSEYALLEASSPGANESSKPQKKKVEKRLAHALKRIKSKGYYAKNFQSLFSLINGQKSNVTDFFNLLRLSLAAIDEPLEIDAKPIEDKMWYLAIDYVMGSKYPTIYHDVDHMFGPHIDREIGIIYCYVFLFCCYETQCKKIRSLSSDLDEYAKADTARKAEDANVVSNDLLTQNLELIQTLEQRSKELERSLAAEKKAHRKSILALEHEMEGLRKTYEDEIASLKDQNAHLIEFILKGDDLDGEEPVSDSIPEETNPPVETQYRFPLPEERVLFLGGHRNLVKKIQALHPKWIYLTDDDFRLRGARKIDVIFFWTAHSSHMLQRKVFSDLADIPPIIYITATNVGLLESEMLSGFNDLKTARSKTVC